MKREYFNLYGMRFYVSGDVKKAREIAYQARRMRFQLDLIGVPRLKLNYPDGSFVTVIREAGQDFANIYVPPREKELIKKEPKIITRIIPYITETEYDLGEDGLLICYGGYNFGGYYELIVPPDEYYNEYELVKNYVDDKGIYWDAFINMYDEGWDSYYCFDLTKNECYAQRYPKTYGIDHTITSTLTDTDTRQQYIDGPFADPDITVTWNDYRFDSSLHYTISESKANDILSGFQAQTSHTWVLKQDIFGYSYWSPQGYVVGDRIEAAWYCVDQDNINKHVSVYMRRIVNGPMEEGSYYGYWDEPMTSMECKFIGLGHHFTLYSTAIDIRMATHDLRLFKLGDTYVCLFHVSIRNNIIAPPEVISKRFIGTIVEGGDYYITDVSNGLKVNETQTLSLAMNNDLGLILRKEEIKE